jgi:hypothetical protein
MTGSENSVTTAIGTKICAEVPQCMVFLANNAPNGATPYHKSQPVPTS